MNGKDASMGGSATTSVNKTKLPILFSLAGKRGLIGKGTSVFDYGCGRYPDHVREFVKGLGGTYARWDPNWFPFPDGEGFSRRYDVVCLSNVLNVIPSGTERVRTVAKAWDLVKPGGRLLVTVYEADKSGASGPSKPGCWQERRVLESYVVDELAGIPGTVRCNGRLFVSDPKRDAQWEYRHFNDGLIDVRFVDGMCVCVGVNIDGKAEAIKIDDTFFSEADVLGLYRKLWDPGWNMDDEKAAYEAQFREWLVENGAKPEVLAGIVD